MYVKEILVLPETDQKDKNLEFHCIKISTIQFLCVKNTIFFRKQNFLQIYITFEKVFFRDYWKFHKPMKYHNIIFTKIKEYMIYLMHIS